VIPFKPEYHSLNLAAGAFFVEQALNLEHQVLQMEWLG